MFEYSFGKRPFCPKRVGFESIDMEIPWKGDWRSGKIKGEPLLIRDYLDDMRIEPVLHLLDPFYQSGHGEGIVGNERPYPLVNNRPFDQRFISLDVDDDLRLEFSGGLRHPVGSGGMIG